MVKRALLLGVAVASIGAASVAHADAAHEHHRHGHRHNLPHGHGRLGAPFASYPTGGTPSGGEIVGPIKQNGADVTLPLSMIVGQAPFMVDASSVAMSTAARFARLEIVPDDKYLPVDGTDDAPEISRANGAACASGVPVVFQNETYALQTPVTGFCTGLHWRGRGWTDAVGNGVATILADEMTSTTVSPISLVSIQSVHIEDIAFTEPNQPAPNATAVVAWTPTVLAPVITVFNSTGTFLRDLMFDGVYSGIVADVSGRLTATDIYGEAFSTLLQVHHSYDSDHIDMVHDWPYWSANSNVLAYTEASKTTMLIGREDTAFIGDIFSFASNQGVQFATDAAGASYNGTVIPAANAPGGVSTADHIRTVSCDGVVSCVYVQAFGPVIDIDQIRTQSQNYGLSFAPSSGTVQTLASGSAIYVGPTGWANFLHVGEVQTYQNLIPIYLTNPSACSNIQIGVQFSDFLYAGSNPSYVDAVPCNGTTSYQTVEYSNLPQVQNVSGTLSNEPAGVTRGVSLVLPVTATVY